MSFNKSLLELSIKGRNFMVRNISKTSPQCIVYIASSSTAGAGVHTITTPAVRTGNAGHQSLKFAETGRTEVIRNSRAPEWTVRVPIDYRFNEWQVLRLEVWDYDICADNELLGQLELELSALIASRDEVTIKRLRLPAPTPTTTSGTTGAADHKPYHQFQVTGELWLTISEVLASKQTVRMQLAAKTLPQKDFLGSSDPYVVITKEDSDGTYTQVHRTDVIHKTLAPIWAEFTVRVHDLCDCDYHKRLYLSVYDWDRHTADDFIGSVSTSLHELNRGQCRGVTALELSAGKGPPPAPGSQRRPNRSVAGGGDHHRKRKSILMRSIKLTTGGGDHTAVPVTTAGIMLVSNIHFTQVPTFVDYMTGAGTQIHFLTAVDFTADSLPYHNRPVMAAPGGGGGGIGGNNCFEHIIQELGQVLAPYDYQGLYAAYGFGARLVTTAAADGLPPPVSHAFNMKAQSVVPYCDGPQDMIRAYRSSLKVVEPAPGGCRQFAPVINESLALAKNFQNGKHYFVLTILTAGSHADTGDTLEAIVKASALPVSVLIVGVGGAAFTALKRLSGDSTCSRGCRTYRDNVQFFQLKNYLSDGLVDSRLAADLLETIPTQMLQYMDSRNYLPQNISSVKTAFKSSVN